MFVPRALALSLLPLVVAVPSRAADDRPCAEELGDFKLPPNLEAMNVPRGSIRRARTTMGTTIALGASGVPCEVATRAFAEVYAEFDRLEQLTSTDGEGSDLAKVNAAAGTEPVAVERELYALIELALDFARLTEGAFDPTFAAMDGVWNFKQDPPTVPSADEVEEKKELVGWREIKLNPAEGTVMLKRKGMRLSLGGIAKGYATDNAVTILRKHGIKNFIIRSGGEVFISGDPGDGQRRVGIPAPRGDKTFALVEVKDRALNISRDADRSFVKDGVRYHHIIDPRTGYPAHHMKTVALVAVDAATADALSTAVFVLGPVAGMELVEQLRGVDAILVDAKDRIYVSSGMSDRLELRGLPAAALAK